MESVNDLAPQGYILCQWRESIWSGKRRGTCRRPATRTASAGPYSAQSRLSTERFALRRVTRSGVSRQWDEKASRTPGQHASLPPTVSTGTQAPLQEGAGVRRHHWGAHPGQLALGLSPRNTRSERWSQVEHSRRHLGRLWLGEVVDVGCRGTLRWYVVNLKQRDEADS